MQTNVATLPRPSATAAADPGSLIVRLNGTLFYSLCAASFLETAACNQFERLLDALAGDEELRVWIEGAWWPRKMARAQALRRYIEATWPEFDWASAYAAFLKELTAHGGYVAQRGTPRREALARCVAAAQAAVFYRCLAGWTDDTVVRDLARAAAAEEAQHFEQFRAAYEHCGRRERMGLASAWRLSQACVRGARDVNVRLAHEAIVQHWYGSQPFPAMDYNEFVVRGRKAVQRHAPLALPPRMLFREWQRTPRAVAAIVAAAPARTSRPAPVPLLAAA